MISSSFEMIFYFCKASLCPKIWQAFAKEKSVPENMYQKRKSGNHLYRGVIYKNLGFYLESI